MNQKIFLSNSKIQHIFQVLAWFLNHEIIWHGVSSLRAVMWVIHFSLTLGKRSIRIQVMLTQSEMLFLLLLLFRIRRLFTIIHNVSRCLPFVLA